MSPQEKVEKDEVTINIGMPRPLHRRLSITCAVLETSLKAALMAGASLWIDENAHAVARALPPMGGDEAKPPPKPGKATDGGGTARPTGAESHDDEADEPADREAFRS